MKYAKIFKKLIDDLSNKTELGNIYDHLFSLQSDEEIEKMLNMYFEIHIGKNNTYGEYGKTDWFAIFHKSIRQCDLFQNCFKKSNKKLLSKDERKRMEELYTVFYDKSVPQDQRDIIKVERKVEYDEYHSYRRKYMAENENENIGGHLDMLLWNAIHIDKDQELYKIFKRVFLEMLMEEKQPA